MDFLTTFAILNCFASPVFLCAALFALYLYAKNRLRADKEKKRYDARIATISRTGLNAVRETWFQEIQTMTYASELEVESKFVYPMMRFLGYSPNDLRMRVEAVVRVGRADIKGISDWVVYKDNKPFIVIEAKIPQQGLDDNVQEQARSYCFAMNVQLYVLANGKEAKLYQRGVGFDELAFQSTTADLPMKWGELYDLIGVSK